MPDTAPVITDVIIPSTPILTLPTAPSISQIAIPTPPGFDKLQFTATLDQIELIPPDASFVYNEDVYTSLLGDALDTKLLADIINGGTGLSPDTEDAIYTRARSRLSQERNTQYEETSSYFASRGFVLPPGALNARLSKIDRIFNNSLEDLNRDIIIKQAELTWQNLKETITAGLSRENQMLTYANAKAQRAFEAAKETIHSSIAVFHARVSYNNILLHLDY